MVGHDHHSHVYCAASQSPHHSLLLRLACSHIPYALFAHQPYLLCFPLRASLYSALDDYESSLQDAQTAVLNDPSYSAVSEPLSSSSSTSTTPAVASTSIRTLSAPAHPPPRPTRTSHITKAFALIGVDSSQLCVSMYVSCGSGLFSVGFGSVPSQPVGGCHGNTTAGTMMTLSYHHHESRGN